MIRFFIIFATISINVLKNLKFENLSSFMKHRVNFHERCNFRTNWVFLDKISKKCDFAIEQYLEKKFFFAFQQFVFYLHFLNSFEFQTRFFRKLKKFKNEKFSKLIREIFEIFLFFDDVFFSRNIIIKFKIIWDVNIVKFHFLIFAFVCDEHFCRIRWTQKLNESH